MSQRPVFVDQTGRRARWFVRCCWALGAACAAYVALVVVALVAPPGVVSLGLGPLLPKTRAPSFSDETGRKVAPAKVLERAVPEASGAARETARPVTPGQERKSPTATSTAVRPQATPTPHASVPAASSPPGRSRARPTPHASRTPPGHR